MKKRGPGFYFVTRMSKDIEILDILMITKDGEYAKWFGASWCIPVWVAEKHIVRWVKKITLPVGFE